MDNVVNGNISCRLRWITIFTIQSNLLFITQAQAYRLYCQAALLNTVSRYLQYPSIYCDALLNAFAFPLYNQFQFKISSFYGFPKKHQRDPVTAAIPDKAAVQHG